MRERIKRSWWMTTLPIVAVVAAAAFVAGGQLRAQDSEPVVRAAQSACNLVTKDEAEQALGNSVVVTDAPKSCSYTVADPASPASLMVTIGPDEATAETFEEAVLSYAAASGSEVREVVAVGDEAYATLSDVISQVLVRSGERYVTIIMINVQTNEEHRVLTMSDLARKALSRME